MPNIFPQFPKMRTPLPKQYAEIYESYYKSNRNGDTTASGAAQKMERWLHKKVANDTRGLGVRKTLEIGAGTLNQLNFESDFSHYDAIEPFSALYSDSPNLSKVRKIYADISEVASEFGIEKANGGGDLDKNRATINPTQNSTLDSTRDSALDSTLDSAQKSQNTTKLYDRIISCATLEHILDLPSVVATACLLLDDNGVFSASIPSQGRLLWTLGYKATTGLEFRLKYGLDYDVIMNYEHCNNQREIIAVCAHFFGNVRKSLFGISDELSLYTHLSCRAPHKSRAREYLMNLK